MAILFIAGKGQAQSGDASVTLSADKDHIIVGDEAHLILSLQHNPSLSKVSWPSMPDSFGKLEVLKKDRIDTVKQGSFVIYKQVLSVTAFDSGMHVIPPVQVRVQPLNGTQYDIQSGGLDILVQTVAVDTTKDIKPIKGILAVKTSWLDNLEWIIGAIVFFIALTVATYFLRRRKPVAAPPPPPVKPIHIRFTERLDALEAKQLWQKGSVKEYYVELTDILREYIEERFGVPALERTTGELMVTASQHPQLCRHTKPLFEILSTADMAKFARAQPLPSEHAAAMQLTKDFIKETAAPPPVTQPAS